MMNLLVTNTRNAQAYAVILALRPYAQKIVATMYGRNRFLARLSSPSANSRLVDKRYYVPSVVEDWRMGRIQRENTEKEEAYIQAVERICEQEKIDVIFPSLEPMVYVFSKNKDRFRARGVLLPIPDYDILLNAMDKYRLIHTATEVGFPCPRTIAVDECSQLETLERDLRYPVVVKPRMSCGGQGFGLAGSRAELLETLDFVKRTYGRSIVQEYIPGSVVKRYAHLWLILDQNNEIKFTSFYRLLRTIFRDASSLVAAAELFSDDGMIQAAADLCRALGLHGVVNIQTKQDPRDGLHKLLDIDFYNFSIPAAQGTELPLLALKVAKGEQFPALRVESSRTVFVAPHRDLLAFVVYLTDVVAARVTESRPIDPENSLPRFAGLWRSYRDTYTVRGKTFDLHFSHFFQDPLVSFLEWAAFGYFIVKKKLQSFGWFGGCGAGSARARRGAEEHLGEAQRPHADFFNH